MKNESLALNMWLKRGQYSGSAARIQVLGVECVVTDRQTEGSHRRDIHLRTLMQALLKVRQTPFDHPFGVQHLIGAGSILGWKCEHSPHQI